ncbi:MAG: hypothetical protein QNJ46_17825 [Leptolyngbyaceae cyanobacterium MO_188.B28]|nr:hypothetical protein [Leptolyngbyaceae cyanobacterium MO_188.B28]
MIIAFFSGRQLIAASWMDFVWSCLGVVAISTAVLCWFREQKTIQAYITELNHHQVSQESRNRRLEKLLAQSKEILAEQGKYNQTLEQSLSKSKKKLAEQEEYSQNLEQCRRNLDDAQVGLNFALTALVSYKMASRPIPGNHQGDYFVEKVSMERINEISTRFLSCWLRVLQDKDNENSKEIREVLDRRNTSTLDLSTFETAIYDLISFEKAETS